MLVILATLPASWPSPGGPNAKLIGIDLKPMANRHVVFEDGETATSDRWGWVRFPRRYRLAPRIVGFLLIRSVRSTGGNPGTRHYYSPPADYEFIGVERGAKPDTPRRRLQILIPLPDKPREIGLGYGEVVHVARLPAGIHPESFGLGSGPHRRSGRVRRAVENGVVKLYFPDREFERAGTREHVTVVGIGVPPPISLRLRNPAIRSVRMLLQ